MCGYACRDVKKYPIPSEKAGKGGLKNLKGELIVSDDSTDPLNHEFKINTLFADGSIEDYDAALFEKPGFQVGSNAREPAKDEDGNYLWPDFRVLTEECR